VAKEKSQKIAYMFKFYQDQVLHQHKTSCCLLNLSQNRRKK